MIGAECSNATYHAHNDGYRVRGGGEAFLHSRAGTMRELDDCFPYDVLGTTGDVGALYNTLQVAAPNIEPDAAGITRH